MKLTAVIKPFKNIWQVFIVMTLLDFVFLHFCWPQSYNSVGSFVVANIWGTTIWVTQAVGNSAVFHYLDEKLPWRDGMLKRALANIVGIAIYSTLAYFVVQVIMFTIFVPEVTWSEMVSQTLESTKITLSISFAISFLLTFIGFGKNMITMEVEKERLQTEMIRYKYDSLKSQINPHFLFNSFNVLTELVYEDQKLAEKFIRQLSDLYRYVLDAKEVELIALEKEVEFIESFTFLLKTRFENRVQFELEVPFFASEMVIPMSLQLLIENCIKHNQATTKKPLVVKIFRTGNVVTVENNWQPKTTPVESHKIGLTNLMERYAYFTEEKVIVTQNEESFIVSIPIISQQ